MSGSGLHAGSVPETSLNPAPLLLHSNINPVPSCADQVLDLCSSVPLPSSPLPPHLSIHRLISPLASSPL